MIRKTLALALFVISVANSQIMGPKISFQQTEYDFGDIVQGEKVHYNFIVTNTGGNILEITNVRASCGCTAALPDKREIQPGESTQIKVEFNSAGRIAKQVKNIFVTSNDKDNPEVTLTISCNIIKPETKQSKNSPQIYFPETQHNFGMVSEGNVVDYTFKFVNKGNSTLDIKEVKTTCGCTAALLSKNKIAPGEEGSLKVELNTANRLGKMSRNITVISNDPEEPSKDLLIYAEIFKEASN
jgi:uncharacterized cupredoxin-like copper-binding protein